MANISRLVKNISNNDPEARKVFESIANKSNTTSDQISANALVPNQAFSAAYNNLGEFSKIIFLDSAFKKLDTIREFDHFCSAYRYSNNKKPVSIRFNCYGYKDHDGDIVITNIDCPLLDIAFSRKFKTEHELYDFISTRANSSVYNIETSSRMYDYLRHNVFTQPSVGTDVVALHGYTKPDSTNCCKISEIAESVIPQISVASNSIMSGVIAITPKTINTSAIYNKNKNSIEDCLEDGSLEVAIISYKKNPNTGTVSPIAIHDVKNSVGIISEQQYVLKISSSNQPLNGIYRAKQQATPEMSQL